MLEKSLSLFPEGDRFAHGATRAERVAQFVKSATEACCRFEASETTHGGGPLFDPSMILLQPIREIVPCPMLDIIAYRLTYGPWIGRMTVCCDLIGSMANHKPVGKTASSPPYLAFYSIANQPSCHLDQSPDRDTTISHALSGVVLQKQGRKEIALSSEVCNGKANLLSLKAQE